MKSSKKENTGVTNALDINEKKRLGALLKVFREERHMNQEEMAGIIGCTGQYISDVERGKYSLSLKKYMTICDHFSVSADELLYGASKDYSEYDIRNRIVRSIDGMNPDQIELLEDQISLMKRMFGK
ncbi:MAG: helix-turn-helix transcriptional regulator [Lachnospiraceae bacterium]|nr:helix-turn-helix transcriptional regulator [Lachnospiraceae bacterium]